MNNGQTIRTAVFLGSFLLIIVGFQNCSIYQSDSRKYFDQNAVGNAQGLTLSQQSSPTPVPSPTPVKKLEVSVCLVTQEVAAAIFGTAVDVQAYELDPSQAPECMVSTLNESLNGSDTAVCSVSQNNLSLYQNETATPGAETVTLNLSAVSGLRIIKEHEDGSAQILFLAPGPTVNEGVQCRFSFETRLKLDQELNLTGLRGPLLLKAILENSIQQ